MKNWKDRISNNISYTEATKSRTAIKLGIKNIPNKEQLHNMKIVAKEIFEPIRTNYGVPIAVTSFFRSKKLNTAIGGSKTSQHCEGKAIDLDADVYGMIRNRDIFNFIKDNLEFDTLIWEFGTDREPQWVHVSYNKGKNRNRILKAIKVKNILGKYKTKYINYEK